MVRVELVKEVHLILSEAEAWQLYDVLVNFAEKPIWKVIGMPLRELLYSEEN